MPKWPYFDRDKGLEKLQVSVLSKQKEIDFILGRISTIAKDSQVIAQIRAVDVNRTSALEKSADLTHTTAK